MKKVTLGNIVKEYETGTTYEKMVPQPSTASKIQQKTITETKQAVKQELKNIEQNAKEIFNFLRGK